MPKTAQTKVSKILEHLPYLIIFVGTKVYNFMILDKLKDINIWCILQDNALNSTNL